MNKENCAEDRELATKELEGNSGGITETEEMGSNKKNHENHGDDHGEIPTSSDIDNTEALLKEFVPAHFLLSGHFTHTATNYSGTIYEVVCSSSSNGFRVEDIALIIGCSKGTIERRLNACQLFTRNYSIIAEDALVQEMCSVFPRSGEKLVYGRLRAQGL